MLDEPFAITWSEPAISALDQAYRYIANDNPAAADNFISEVDARVSQLATLPEIGFKTKVRHLRGAVRELVVQRYRILYRPDLEENCIRILLVWHTSRRNPKQADF